ncbi:methyltransferase domain-containing protein [Aquimarina sp. I32.4]|uniref:methyltransferase domain-containing protein n=1 Tax=Aquimarina sp. I32.4 TaxID=2053903 RepID=UPI001E53F5F1|nr:methyltransferase domain-containing protein [Aquimarina sp. I32.4]
MDYKNKPEGYYDNIKHEMVKYLHNSPKKIIDIGFGNEAFVGVLKEQTGAEVWGVEYMDKETQVVNGKLDKIFSGKWKDYINELSDNYFDTICFNNVLEYLVDSYMVLDMIKHTLTSKGCSNKFDTIVHSMFMRILLKKDWLYEDFGVIDRIYLRFFTRKRIRRMYEETGYLIMTNEEINKCKSLKPCLYNIPLFFTQLDIRYPQYATVTRFKNNN